jgi:hypothetical protein
VPVVLAVVPAVATQTLAASILAAGVVEVAAALAEAVAPMAALAVPVLWSFATRRRSLPHSPLGWHKQRSLMVISRCLLLLLRLLRMRLWCLISMRRSLWSSSLSLVVAVVVEVVAVVAVLVATDPTYPVKTVVAVRRLKRH